MKNLVLTFTLSRIAFGPLIFYLSVFLESYFISLIVFILAALTDYLDGKLARAYGVTSKLGAILDPIADKLLLIFALLSIIHMTHNPFLGLISALILAREMWISGLREYASFKNLTDATKVTLLAKVKTSVQFIAISMFYFGFYIDEALIIFLASFVLFLALLLSLKSAVNYTLKVFKKV